MTSPLVVTAYRSLRDVTPLARASYSTLADVAAEFAAPTLAEAKESVPLLSFADLRPGTSRANANVVSISAFVGDVDDVPEAAFVRALDRLEARGIEYLTHSTWSHHAAFARGLVRARIIVPFAAPVAAAAWGVTWPRMQAFVGGILDPSCRDVSRAYFAYSTPREGAESAFIFRVPGRRFAP